ERDQPEHGLEQRRLAHAVRTEDGDELPGLHRQGDLGPDGAAAARNRGPVELDDRGHPTARSSAACTAVSSATCQSWKRAPDGDSVSVTATTGMPARRAAVTWAATSGVEFCSLYTYTLILFSEIWASIV